MAQLNRREAAPALLQADRIDALESCAPALVAPIDTVAAEERTLEIERLAASIDASEASLRHERESLHSLVRIDAVAAARACSSAEREWLRRWFADFRAAWEPVYARDVQPVMALPLRGGSCVVDARCYDIARVDAMLDDYAFSSPSLWARRHVPGTLFDTGPANADTEPPALVRALLHRLHISFTVREQTSAEHQSPPQQYGRHTFSHWHA